MTRNGSKRNGLRALGAAVLAFLSVGAAAQSRHLPAAQAPAAWVAYAQRVSQQFQSALEGDSADAQQVQEFFDQQAASGDDPSRAPLVLSIKTWLDAQGRVVRVEFAPLGDHDAEDGLRSLLLMQSAGAPPRGMRQPLVVRIQLSAASGVDASNAQPESGANALAGN